MTKYVSALEKANEWNVSIRKVQILCKSGKINGALKKSGVWLIPDDACQEIKCKNEKKLNLLSLFSGCGGMDLGFEGGFEIFTSSYNARVNSDWKVKKRKNNRVLLPSTRFQTIFANDIRPDARTAWTSYFEKKRKHTSVYCLDSIVDLVKLHKDNGINIFPSNVDIVTGGFPCQDFSIAGKRMGFNSSKSHYGGKNIISEPSIENRGKLYIWMKEVITITQPKIFVAENVKGLINLDDAKNIIESDFSNISGGGYLVLPARVLLAANYGVSQNRERVIFIGIRKKSLKHGILDLLEKKDIPVELDPYPQITHSNDKIAGLKSFVTLQDILSDLVEPELSDDIDHKSYSKAKFMGKHCQGQNEINLDGIAPTIRSEHHGNIEYRRLSKENGGRYINEIDRGMKERRLTIRECARIQTFPDDYNFIQKGKNKYKNVSASDAYKLIGNAVPPLMAFHIAMRIQSLWNTYFGE